MKKRGSGIVVVGENNYIFYLQETIRVCRSRYILSERNWNVHRRSLIFASQRAWSVSSLDICCKTSKKCHFGAKLVIFPRANAYLPFEPLEILINPILTFSSIHRSNVSYQAEGRQNENRSIRNSNGSHPRKRMAMITDRFLFTHDNPKPGFYHKI